ncbi:MAG: phosphotransferase [Candidatus Scalindua sp.]|jgi:tRNA A-37 threonylcarbamoyl transferase component Bud32|nr:phosphotransferase [Candidatus Scalindua sp.]
MKKIGIGRTAEVYDYEDDKVLKLFYSAFSVKTIEDEYLIAKGISTTTSLVPRVYDIVHIKNRTGIVYEKIKGKMLSDYLSGNIINARRIIRKFAQTQKRINNINVKAIPNYTGKLRQRISSSCLLSDPEKKTVLKYLSTINNNEICHGDYHPENVFVDQNHDFKVIDWANMFVSNKYLDIARTYYLIKSGRSLNGKTKLGSLIEWFGRQIIAKFYWEEVKAGKGRKEYFLPCLFIIIITRYDENIEQEKKGIYNYVKKNKEEMLKAMDVREGESDNAV